MHWCLGVKMTNNFKIKEKIMKNLAMKKNDSFGSRFTQKKEKINGKYSSHWDFQGILLLIVIHCRK